MLPWEVPVLVRRKFILLGWAGIISICTFSVRSALADLTIPSNRLMTWAGGMGLDAVGGIPSYPSVTCAGLHPDNSTDDTAKINSCISAAAANSAVLIPAGSYKVSGDILMKSRVVLRGAGAAPPFLPGAQDGSITTVLNMTGK